MGTSQQQQATIKVLDLKSKQQNNIHTLINNILDNNPIKGTLRYVMSNIKKIQRTKKNKTSG